MFYGVKEKTLIRFDPKSCGVYVKEASLLNIVNIFCKVCSISDFELMEKVKTNFIKVIRNKLYHIKHIGIRYVVDDNHYYSIQAFVNKKIDLAGNFETYIVDIEDKKITREEILFCNLLLKYKNKLPFVKVKGVEHIVTNGDRFNTKINLKLLDFVLNEFAFLYKSEQNEFWQKLKKVFKPKKESVYNDKYAFILKRDDKSLNAHDKNVLRLVSTEMYETIFTENNPDNLYHVGIINNINELPASIITKLAFVPTNLVRESTYKLRKVFSGYL